MTFAPKAAGLRYGGVVLENGSQNPIALGYIHGIGLGPQISFQPLTRVVLGHGFNNPVGLALDGAGNVYVADSDNNAIKEVLASGGYATINTLGGGFSGPAGVAVDGGGNVFVADTFHNAVKEIPSGCTAASCVETLGSGFNEPYGIAVDGSGNVFVADTLNYAVKEIMAAGGYVTVNTLGGGFNKPYGVAVDGSGNVFVADTFNNAVKEIPSGCTSASCVKTLSSDFNQPYGVAVDGVGNVFVADYGNSATKEIAAASNYESVYVLLASPYSDPAGVAVDGVGNVYFTNATTGYPDSQRVVKLDFADAPSLTFPTATPIGSLDTADGAATVTVQNIGNQPLIMGGLAYSANFTLDFSTTCTSPAVGAGTSCVVGMLFYPTAAGALTGTLALTDNALNVNGATQQISLSGTGSAASSKITPTVTVALSATGITVTQPLTVTVTVNGGSGNPTPTGSVTLSGGGYTLPAISLAGGSAIINISAGALATGADTLTASYVPDSASSSTYTTAAGASTVVVTSVTSASPVIVSDFGTVPIGQTSATASLVFTFSGSVTIGSVTALTQGAPGLDFAVVGGGTCAAGASFSSGNTCTVNVTFTPKYSGLRNGGIVLQDGSGNTIAMQYVHGVGLGPQLTFQSTRIYTWSTGYWWTTNSPNGMSLLGGGFGQPNVAVDGAGNVFVADKSYNVVRKVPPGCAVASCVTYLSGFSQPTDVAVDGAGNLFVSEAGYNDVREVPFGCTSESCFQTIGSGFNAPAGVAVDSSGNVYVADTFNNAVKEVLASGGYTTVQTLGSGFTTPQSVAVDGSGNVFVADVGTGCAGAMCATGFLGTAVKEIVAAGGYTTVKTLVSGNFGIPFGLATDGSGNVFVADYSDGGVTEIMANGGYTNSMALDSGKPFAFWDGVAVDGSRNLYLPDVVADTVTKLDYTGIPSITFATAIPAGTTDTQDGTQGVTLQNNGTAPLQLSSMVFSNSAFQFDSKVTSCATATPIEPGSSCLIGVAFSPTTTGTFNGTLTLTDNDMNGSGVTQQINISALTLPPSPVITAQPVNPTTATSASFTFSDTQAGVTFVCSLDTVPFTACTSPMAYPLLSGGAHTFAVKAKDPLGNLSSAATYAWLVNAVGPPPPVITSYPVNPTAATTASFAFTDTQANVSFLCSLDGATYAACSSGVSYSSLSNGANTFAVEAKDTGGNVSAPTNFNWWVEETRGCKRPRLHSEA